MKNLKSKLGFTLIELLVVITIIAILSTVGVNQFGKSLQKARDSKRTADILSLKTAVTQAFTDDQEYPSSEGLLFSGAVLAYLVQFPVDGKHGQPGNTDAGGDPALGYTYISGDDNGGIRFATFEISTSYEAGSNIKNAAKKDSGNDDNRYEIGDIANGGGFVGGMSTEFKDGGTCTAANTDNTKALIIGGAFLCAASDY